MQKIKQELEASEPQTALTKKSSWIKKINQEKVERRERIEKEKRDKEEQLRTLLEEDDLDDSFVKRYKDLSGKGLFDYLSKIEDTM